MNVVRFYDPPALALTHLLEAFRVTSYVHQPPISQETMKCRDQLHVGGPEKLLFPKEILCYTCSR